MLDMCLLCVSI